MEKYMLYMGLLMTGIMTDNGSMNKMVALCIYGVLASRLAVWYFRKINEKEWYYEEKYRKQGDDTNGK